MAKDVAFRNRETEDRLTAIYAAAVAEMGPIAAAVVEMDEIPDHIAAYYAEMPLHPSEMPDWFQQEPDEDARVKYYQDHVDGVLRSVRA